MAMSIIEDIEQEEREQEKDSFGEDDDDELFDDDCVQKRAGYPPPWRTDRCDFSRRRKNLHGVHYNWYFRVRFGVRKKKSSPAFKTGLLE
mgnify:CR=1 FL=1